MFDYQVVHPGPRSQPVGAAVEVVENTIPLLVLQTETLTQVVQAVVDLVDTNQRMD